MKKILFLTFIFILLIPFVHAQDCPPKCQPEEIPTSIGCPSGLKCCCSRSPTGCYGSIDLTFSPNPVIGGRTVTASVSGLNNCDGETVRIKGVGQCAFNLPENSCTLTAPSEVGNYSYKAYSDINGNGIVNCNREPDECVNETLTVIKEVSEGEKECWSCRAITIGIVPDQYQDLFITLVGILIILGIILGVTIFLVIKKIVSP